MDDPNEIIIIVIMTP